LHRAAHFPYRFPDADKNGPRHDGMTDVQLLNFGNPGHGTDVAHRQTVTRVDRQAKPRALRRGLAQGTQCTSIFSVVRITPCVELDGVGAGIARARHRVRVGIDEQAASDSGAAKALNGA
jgi:hypothetical protein